MTLVKLLQLMKREWLITSHTKTGFSLIEALLSIALFSLLISTLVGGALYGQQSVVLAGNRERATALAEEGLEAVRNLRDADYTNLVPGSYGLSTGDHQWELRPAADQTGIFSRRVTITADAEDTASIVATVSWQWVTNRTNSVTLTTYLTNWK